MLTAVSAAVTKVEHLYVIKFFQVRPTFPLFLHPVRLLTNKFRDSRAYREWPRLQPLSER
jgi:hypothetical protein